MISHTSFRHGLENQKKRLKEQSEMDGLEKNREAAGPLMTFEEVRGILKQQFPMIMVDSVIALDPGESILTTKKITRNEFMLPGRGSNHGVIPGTLIVEAIGQSASILFSKTSGAGTQPEDFLVLGSINEMQFPARVVPGDSLKIDVQVIKFIGGYGLVKAVATVEGVVVATGKLGFAKRGLHAPCAD